MTAVPQHAPAKTLSQLINLPMPEAARAWLRGNGARIRTALEENDAEAAASYVVQSVVAALKAAGIDAPFTMQSLRAFIRQHNGWGPIELALGDDPHSQANGAAAIYAFLSAGLQGSNVRALPPANERPQARYDRKQAQPSEPQQQAPRPGPREERSDDRFERQGERNANPRLAARQSAVAGAKTESASSDDRTRFDERVVTPRGVALFPYLDKPDYEYHKEGLYKVELVIDPNDPAAVALFDTMTRVRDTFFDETYADLKARKKFDAMEALQKRDFFGPDRDDEGNRTGLVRIRAKSKAQWIRNDGSTAQRQPLAFDADARRIEMPAVFSGSELILSCIARPYYKADGHQVGCSLLLEAVQICRLVGPRSGGAADTAEGHGFAPQRRR